MPTQTDADTDGCLHRRCVIQARQLRSDARRNRERLIAEASELFASQGVEASLEEIARRAGVGIGTLYRHFPSRDALLEAVFRHHVEQLCAEANGLLEAEPADAALAWWMERLVSEVTRRRGLGTYLKTVVSADSDLFASTHDRIHAATARLVEAAAASGGIRSDVDPADLLRALSGVCLVEAEPGDVDQALRISRLLMDGLRYRRAETVGRAPD